MKLAILAASSLLAASSAFAGQVIPVGPFSGIRASDGAYVVVRYGAHQRVTLVKGSTEFTRIGVSGGKLEVVTCDKGWRCPHHYELEVDVETPMLASAEASDGANIQAQGRFPTVPRLAAHASDGGQLDLRALPAREVHAKADDGGNLMVRAVQALDAVAEDGGNVEYWGNPRANIRAVDGGNVSKGG